MQQTLSKLHSNLTAGLARLEMDSQFGAPEWIDWVKSEGERHIFDRTHHVSKVMNGQFVNS